ncbi:MAG TPA: cobalamin-dependent protein [Solirubrobacteraceae bacterium]|nr:cobalamin-dependent protein [Solirubrobacteraceae bacterium]
MSDTLGVARAVSPEALEREYLTSLLAPDLGRARELIDEALTAGLSAREVYLRVIAPAMTEIGRLWETARISVAQEHLATQISQIVLAGLAGRLAGADDVGRGRVAIVASTPGERHALGTHMVADFLEVQGWRVLALGADVPARELVELAAERRAAVVALSTALPGHLLAVTRTCQLLRRLDPPPHIIAGGRAYRDDPAQARAVGADAFAADPDAMLDHLAAVFGADARG